MKTTNSATSSTFERKFTVLVAEDDQATRLLMLNFLRREGYAVFEAEDGRQCLELYPRLTPDLILVDGLMPVMDGFEFCHRLRQQAEARAVPVLMVTALEDKASVDQAFEAGATDYITKPIHWAVLRQRVRHLLQARYMEELRNDLTQMIVHDMKTPLVAINGYMELLLNTSKANFDPGQFRAVQRSYQNNQRLLDMVMLLLDLGRIENGKLSLQPARADVLQMLRQAVEHVDWMAQNYGVELVIEYDDPDLKFTLDWTLIQRVLINLLTNALKHSPRGSQVLLSAYHHSGENLIIKVKDVGEGIAEEDQSRIFDKYTQASRRQEGSNFDSGLGLTFCKLAVEAQAGLITLQSSPGFGSIFSLVFPELGAAHG